MATTRGLECQVKPWALIRSCHRHHKWKGRVHSQLPQAYLLKAKTYTHALAGKLVAPDRDPSGRELLYFLVKQPCGRKSIVFKRGLGVAESWRDSEASDSLICCQGAHPQAALTITTRRQFHHFATTQRLRGPLVDSHRNGQLDTLITAAVVVGKASIHYAAAATS